MCRKPFVEQGAAFGCGQCLPCRMNRRRVWTHRIVLEAAKHTENSFVTLTYKPELEPADGVRPLDLQKWIKRVRFAAEVPLRFYGVGEYGEQSKRPHYHVALFGFKGCARGDSRLGRQPCPCASCELVRRSWPFGLVHQGRVEAKSAQYLAGYTVKGMTRGDDPRLGGRHAEFARMSLRPGVGAHAMRDVGAVLRGLGFPEYKDVPPSLRHGAKELPLGRYLLRRLRGELGREPGTPEIRLAEINEQLRVVREAAAAHSDPELYAPGRFSQEVFRRLLVELDAEKVKVMEARRKIFERGKK